MEKQQDALTSLEESESQVKAPKKVRKIKNYNHLKQIGSGAFATVFRGTLTLHHFYSRGREGELIRN